MGTLLAGWWSAIWPNLAANIIWVPIGWAGGWAGGVWLKGHILKHLSTQHEDLKAHVTNLVESATARKG